MSIVTACIVARLKSQRLPGKALLPVGDMTAIEVLLNRVNYSTKIQETRLCTSDLKRDDSLEELATKHGVITTRGGDDDVLNRLLKAARDTNADYVVRITGDDILIDTDVMDDMISHSILNKIDYCYCPDIIRGMDCEVISTKALIKILIESKDTSGTEYLSYYIEEIPGIKTSEWSLKRDYSFIRLTMDWEQDYEAIKNVYTYFDGYFSYQDVYKLYEEKPEVFQCNKVLPKPSFDLENFKETYVYNS